MLTRNNYTQSGMGVGLISATTSNNIHAVGKFSVPPPCFDICRTPQQGRRNVAGEIAGQSCLSCLVRLFLYLHRGPLKSDKDTSRSYKTRCDGQQPCTNVRRTLCFTSSNLQGRSTYIYWWSVVFE